MPDDFLALTDENSWDWVEADTVEQAVERFKRVLGASYLTSAEDLQPCWMAESEDDPEMWDRVIGPDLVPGAIHGYIYEGG